MSTQPDEHCAARTSFGTAMTLCGEGLKSGFYLNKGILPRLMKGASGKNVVPSIINDFIQLTELWLLTSGLQCGKIWLQKYSHCSRSWSTLVAQISGHLPEDVWPSLAMDPKQHWHTPDLGEWRNCITFAGYWQLSACINSSIKDQFCYTLWWCSYIFNKFQWRPLPLRKYAVLRLISLHILSSHR